MAEQKLALTKSDTAYNLKAADIPDAETKTGFLDLPAELRNDIYDMLLITEKDIGFGLLIFGDGINGIRYSLYVRNGKLFYRLLLVCSQIYQEAKPVLYGGNHFVVKEHELLHFQNLVMRSLKLIRNLTIEYRYSNQRNLKNCLLATQAFENLDLLEIDSKYFQRFKSVASAIRFFRPILRTMRNARAGTDKRPVAEMVEFEPTSGQSSLWFDDEEKMTEFLEKVFK